MGNVLKNYYRSGLLFCLVLSLGACAQNPISEIQDSALSTWSADSKALALEWLVTASHRFSTSSDAEMSKFASEVHDILQGAQLMAIPAAYANECEVRNDGSFVAAFMVENHNSHNIYICPHSMHAGTEFMAQVLIHESIHLWGIYDECHTTELEHALVMAADQFPYESRYVAECGL